MKATRDLTQGSPLKNIIVFSVPFLLSYFLQTLYGLADLYIIGQFNEAASISAVAIGSQVMHMITVMIVALSTGTLVHIGQAVGAKEEKRIQLIIGNTISLFAILSFLLCGLLLVLNNYIVSVMQTPAEAAGEAKKYLIICFIGIPFIIAYNVISAVFRGLGDSKSPMWFIACACVINIILDYVLVGGFHMQAEGAAYATIIAQTISVLLALYVIRKKQLVKLEKNDLRLRKDILSAILKTGLPITAQDGCIQISFLIITIIANRRGLVISAAVGIVEKIITFLFLVPSTMLSTISSICSQAIGAGRKDLARKTLFYCMAIAVSIGLIFAISFQFISPFVIGQFTSDAEVVAMGVTYLRSYVFDCMIASLHFCFSGFFVASGYSIISFIHNMISIVCIRVPGAYLASVLYPWTLFPMGLAAPMGGILQLVICLGFYIYLRKKDKI